MLLPRLIVDFDVDILNVSNAIHFPDVAFSGEFSVSEETNQAFCKVQTAESIFLVHINCENGYKWNDTTENGNQVTMVPSKPLLSNSFLTTAKTKAKVVDDKPPQLYKPISQIHRQPGTLDKRGKIVDKQAITFHSKVKSSGYGTVKPFSHHSTQQLRRHSAIPTSKGNLGTTRQKQLLPQEYPMSANIPSTFETSINLSETSGCVTSLQMSSNSNYLAFSLTTGLLGMVNPKSMSNPKILVKHKQCVRKVGFSNDNSWLCAGSDDGTSSFWHTATGNLAYQVEDLRKPVNHVQFYYVDKFILMAVGNRLLIYSYAFTNQKSDIKRYQVNSVVKKINEHQLVNAVAISCAVAPNVFHSYLSICGGSDHSLNIADMNTGQWCVQIPQAHSKSVHCVAIAGDGVTNAHVPQHVYNLFASMAVGDAIKLWDTRLTGPIGCFLGHVNRSCPYTKVSFSPCARFIAASSEDKSVYIFDIRSPQRPLQRIPSQPSNEPCRINDTTTAITFDTKIPTLFIGTLQGTIHKCI